MSSFSERKPVSSEAVCTQQPISSADAPEARREVWRRRECAINPLANLRILNNKTCGMTRERLTPKHTRKKSAEKHLGHQQHRGRGRGKCRHGGGGPVHGGDKETEEVGTAPSHNGTRPEQSPPALQCFLQQFNPNGLTFIMKISAEQTIHGR